MMRQTKNGVFEADGDTRWMSEYHLIHYEVEGKQGEVKMRTMPGLRKSSKIISFRDKITPAPSFLK